VADEGKPVPPSSSKAEMMGRVEWVSMQGGRDITARKSIEWGDVQEHENGNRSIRYRYYATIWDRDKYEMNHIFTFDKQGNPVSREDVEGFPKKVEKKVWDVTTQKGMIELVEDFFSKNFRDITNRDTIEWDQVIKDEKGNSSIRYKYHATIRDKEKKVMNQVFTFDPSGEFVSVKDVGESRK
jgi:hypothetical protein